MAGAPEYAPLLLPAGEPPAPPVRASVPRPPPGRYTAVTCLPGPRPKSSEGGTLVVLPLTVLVPPDDAEPAPRAGGEAPLNPGSVGTRLSSVSASPNSLCMRTSDVWLLVSFATSDASVSLKEDASAGSSAAPARRPGRRNSNTSFTEATRR